LQRAFTTAFVVGASAAMLAPAVCRACRNAQLMEARKQKDLWSHRGTGGGNEADVFFLCGVHIFFGVGVDSTILRTWLGGCLSPRLIDRFAIADAVTDTTEGYLL
jgi:hypothetical protein